MSLSCIYIQLCESSMIDSSEESRGAGWSARPCALIGCCCWEKMRIERAREKRERERETGGRGGRASNTPQQFRVSAERGGGEETEEEEEEEWAHLTEGFSCRTKTTTSEGREEKKKSGSEVGGRRDQHLRRRKEGFSLFFVFFSQSATGETLLFFSPPYQLPPLFLLHLHPPHLCPSLHPPSILPRSSLHPPSILPPSSLHLQSGWLWRLRRKLTSVLGCSLSLSLSLSLSACVGVLARPSLPLLLFFFFSFFGECFGCESELPVLLMHFLRHAALFAVQGFSSAAAAATAAASGGCIQQPVWKQTFTFWKTAKSEEEEEEDQSCGLDIFCAVVLQQCELMSSASLLLHCWGIKLTETVCVCLMRRSPLVNETWTGSEPDLTLTTKLKLQILILNNLL